MRRVTKFIAHAERFSNRWWYSPLLALLAGIDLFVGFIPTDGVVISSVLLQPKRWIGMFLWASAGSALGALALSLAVHGLGVSVIQPMFHKTLESTTWVSIASFLIDYGAPALALISISPFPQQPAVVLCALAGLPLTPIFLAIFIGRGLKYGLFAWAASHAPKLIEKFKGARREAKEIEKIAQEELVD
jgi:membrane protein YqaA with SNARE-associated domain